MAPKKKQKQSEGGVDVMATHGAQLCESTHRVAMEKMWHHLYTRPALASHIHVMIVYNSFDVPDEKQEKWLTSNNKMHLAPRGILDGIHKRDMPPLQAYFERNNVSTDKVTLLPY